MYHRIIYIMYSGSSFNKFNNIVQDSSHRATTTSGAAAQPFVDAQSTFMCGHGFGL
jgi:hypothetical protein